MAKKKTNYIWVAVLVSLVVVLALGHLVFNYVKTPVERPWDYGTVPFVPAKSHYSNERVPLAPLPNPNATRPPEAPARQGR
jgi:hypothetical protein